mgnify:CR=1 FL=1
MKKSKKDFIVATILVVGVLLAIGGSVYVYENRHVYKNGMATYIDTQNGFEFKYPKDEKIVSLSDSSVFQNNTGQNIISVQLKTTGKISDVTCIQGVDTRCRNIYGTATHYYDTVIQYGLLGNVTARVPLYKMKPILLSLSLSCDSITTDSSGKNDYCIISAKRLAMFNKLFTTLKSTRTKYLYQNTYNNMVSNSINPRDYSVIKYSLKQSPIYNQFNTKNCGTGTGRWTDTRLVKNKTQVIIPSLVQLISSLENIRPSCEMSIRIFSAPSSGKYLYLKSKFIFSHDPLYGIYSLDLSNLSVKKLAITNQLAADYSYKILNNGKRFIMWNQNEVYLVNLEKDSTRLLYITKKNQWFYSKIVIGPGPGLTYNIKIKGNRVLIGVYDKTKTKNGYPVKIDTYGNIDILKKGIWKFSYELNPRFIKQVVISIPN